MERLFGDERGLSTELKRFSVSGMVREAERTSILAWPWVLLIGKHELFEWAGIPNRYVGR
jgi:hypothetical protein